MEDVFTREMKLASPDGLWDLVHDVEALAACSAYVSDVTESEGGWQASLVSKVGPFKLEAPLFVEIVNEREMESIDVRARGEDTRVGTRLSVDATLELQPSQNRAVLNGRYEVTGSVANLGSAVVRRHAKQMIDDFWKNLERKVGDG